MATGTKCLAIRGFHAGIKRAPEENATDKAKTRNTPAAALLGRESLRQNVFNSCFIAFVPCFTCYCRESTGLVSTLEVDAVDGSHGMLMKQPCVTMLASKVQEALYSYNS